MKPHTHKFVEEYMFEGLSLAQLIVEPKPMF